MNGRDGWLLKKRTDKKPHALVRFFIYICYKFILYHKYGEKNNRTSSMALTERSRNIQEYT